MRAILTYHSIDGSGSPISVPPDVFKEHLNWMSQSDVRVLSLNELLSLGASDPSNALAITFDDGFKNFNEAAARLADLGLPVTLFVVTGHVGGTNAWGGRADPGIPTLPLLDWPELERLVASGVVVGAHTRTHARLTTLPTAAVDEEMDACSEELRARLGVSVSSFAYPYGATDDRIAEVAGRRFAAAVTTRFAPLTPASPRTRLPRLDMYYFRQPGALGAWGTASFKRRLWSVRMRRQVREALAC